MAGHVRNMLSNEGFWASVLEEVIKVGLTTVTRIVVTEVTEHMVEEVKKKSKKSIGFVPGKF